MTGQKGTCGFHGGINKKRGTPCTYPAGRGTDHKGEGRCSMHDEGSMKVEEMNRKKKRFLELLQTNLKLKFVGACRKLGVGPTTLYYWRQEDPQFDDAVEAAKKARMSARVDTVEDVLYTRIVDGKDKPSDIPFFMINNSGGRYKDVKQVHISGPGEGPIQVEEVDARERLLAELNKQIAQEETSEDLLPK